MQWSADRNGGFSRADFATLYLPPLMDPVYGYNAVNVEAGVRDTSSFLRWLRSMLAVRRRFRVFGAGEFGVIDADNPAVFAYVRRLPEGDTGRGIDADVLCVCNLSARAQPVHLDVCALSGCTPVELTGDTVFPTLSCEPYRLSLTPYGFFWFRLDGTPARGRDEADQ
jgi:maltose alpha-D-glucosyltransferase/alpha-amylase